MDRQLILLTSNWNTFNGTELHSILIDSTSDNNDIDTADIKTENCVCLVNNDNSKPHLQMKVIGCMEHIALMSEAQVIEVFGVNDEYLSTHTAEFLDDCEEMAVYYSRIPLPNIPVCKLKFTRTRNKDRVWIYGMKVNVHKMRRCETGKPFNIEQINRLLGNRQLSNLDNANSFSNLLQMYMKNLPNNNSVGRKETGVMGEDEEMSDHLSNLKINDNTLKSYVDDKLSEMKKEILQEVDVRLNVMREETNHKLDRIISLLEEHDRGC